MFKSVVFWPVPTLQPCPELGLRMPFKGKQMSLPVLPPKKTGSGFFHILILKPAEAMDGRAHPLQGSARTHTHTHTYTPEGKAAQLPSPPEGSGMVYLAGSGVPQMRICRKRGPTVYCF